MQNVSIYLEVPNLAVAMSFFAQLEVFKLENLSLGDSLQRALVSFPKENPTFHLDLWENGNCVLAEKSAGALFDFEIEEFETWHHRVRQSGAPVGEIHDLPYASTASATTPFGGFIRFSTIHRGQSD
jgi:hypothetical protein